MPDISIVMSAYNGAEYLSASIGSVLAQTERDFEFIIVNDGSTDAAVDEVLTDYALRDSRIRVISKSNEGLTRALIDGCAAAKGKYIARIDVGDVMLLNRLDRQRAVLDAHPEAVLVTCWTEFCGPEWEPLFTVRNTVPENADSQDWVSPFPDDGEDRNRLLGPTHHGSVMFRREPYDSAGGYRTAFYYGQDWDLWYRLADKGEFAGVQEVLYRCRIIPDGISMRNAERQQQIHACSRGAFLARRKGEDETLFLEKAAAIRPSKAARRKMQSASSSAAGYYFIGEVLRGNKDNRCRKYYHESIACNFFYLTAWIRLAQTYLRTSPTLSTNGNLMRIADSILRFVSGVTRRSFSIRGMGRAYRTINRCMLGFGAEPVVIAHMKDGTQLLVDLRTHTEVDAYYRGEYDALLQNTVKRLFRPDMIFLDVGANIGFYTICIGNHIRSANGMGRVISYEPFPGNYARLQENIKRNHLEHVCHTEMIALSNQAGNGLITLREDFEHGSSTGNASIAINDVFDQGFQKVPIKLKTLDDAAGGLNIKSGVVDIIKLDIEGHEGLCLQGGRKTVHTHRPTILMEVNKAFYEARNATIEQEVLPQLPARYRIYRWQKSGWVQIDSFLACNPIDNVFLVPEEKMNMKEYAVFA